MFDKLRQMKFNMDMVIDCQEGLINHVLQQSRYAMVFKTTNWCWNNCAHCCENSGSKMPKTFIPEFVITGYIDDALQDEKFGREIVFTGGEIMSAYKFAGEDYVPNILNHALKSGCGVDIKTNAGWVKSPLAKQVYADIESIFRGRSTGKDGLKRGIKFQMSLSLDSFHRDALMRDLEFIKHFANTDIPGVVFEIHVSGIYQDKNMFPELMHQLVRSGIKVDKLLGIDGNNNIISLSDYYDLNGNVLLNYSMGKLFNAGRAMDMKNALRTPYSQFSFVDQGGFVLVAFDSFGNVTLGENSGKKISTQWRNTDGMAKPLNTVRQELLENTKQAERDFLAQHRVLDGYFNLCRMFVK